MKTVTRAFLFLICASLLAAPVAANTPANDGGDGPSEPSIHGRTTAPALEPAPALPAMHAQGDTPDCQAVAADAAAYRAYEGEKLLWNMRRIVGTGASYGIKACSAAEDAFDKAAQLSGKAGGAFDKAAQAAVSKTSACRAAFDALVAKDCAGSSDDACRTAAAEKKELDYLDSQNARFNDDIKSHAKERRALARCQAKPAAQDSSTALPAKVTAPTPAKVVSIPAATPTPTPAPTPVAAAPATPPPAPQAQSGGLGGFFGSIVDGAKDLGKTIVNGATDIGNAVVNGVKTVVQGGVDVAKTVVSTVNNVVVQPVKKALGWVASKVTGVLDTIGKWTFDVGTSIMNYGKSLQSNAGGGVLGFLKGLAGGAINAIGQVVQAPWRLRNLALPAQDKNKPDFTNVDCSLLFIFNCDTPKANYAPVKGELAENGAYSVAFSTSDIRQLYIGDCYFMSSLATIAEQHPDWLAKNMHDNGDGTYSMTMYDGSGNPHTIKVTNQFPVDAQGNPVFAGTGRHDGSTGQDVIWPLVAEKAYAERSLNGSYNWIGNGGFPDSAMQTLTGKKSSTYSAGSVSFTQLAQWFAAGDGLVIATQSGSGETYLNDRLVHSHAYFVKSLDLKNKTITIGNPWGSFDATLTEQEFQQYLSSVYVNPIE